MDNARIALATLATIGSGIALGLAANPTMRPMPEPDWRARYRASTPAPPPAPQPGVSYFGDGSTAWAWGGRPVRINDSLPPMHEPAVRYEPEQWTPPPPQPDLPRDDFDAEASAAERAAAQAAVSAAVIRSEPRGRQGQADAAPPAEPADQDQPAAAVMIAN